MTYNETDQLLHHLSQVLAKFGRTYVKAGKDDAHTSLGYGPINRRLFSRWSEKIEMRHILSLELNPLTFVLLDDAYRRELEVVMQGKTIQEVEEELVHAFNEIGILTKGFKKPMHYEIPDYGFEDRPIENLSNAAFREWTDLRALANQACHQIQAHFQVREEVRIWPHHFDTGIFVPLNKSLSIGFGLAMKDEVVDAPYFYYTARYYGKTHWPEDTPMEVEVGRIIESDAWCGAVLEAPNADPHSLRQFMKDASAYYLGFLE